MNVKMVIVFRADLNLRKGKVGSQAGHSASYFIFNRLKRAFSVGGGKTKYTCELSEVEEEWIKAGHTKICVRVENEEELLSIYKQAKEANIEANLVKDAGLTEIAPGTITCCAIGPDNNDKIDPITSHLKLY
jgi:PTH2 family peptidyl-tRNA hydrolase